MEERERQGSLLKDCVYLVGSHPESVDESTQDESMHVLRKGSLEIAYNGNDEYENIVIKKDGKEIYRAESINPGFCAEDDEIMVDVWVNQVDNRTKDEIIKYLREL